MNLIATTTRVPEWRAGAAKGQTLASLQGKAQKADTNPLPKPDLGQAMMRIIRPEVQQRWLLPQLAAITPMYIEQVLRGALNGAHIQQWELFELMEDTWPRLMKNLNEVKMAACAMDWKIEAYEEDDTPASDSAKEKAQLAKRAVRRMRPTPGCDEQAFAGIIYDVLDAWAKGVSVIELEWEVLDGDVLPRCGYWVHPRNYGWTQAGNLALVQNDGGMGIKSPTGLDGYGRQPVRGILPGNILTGGMEIPPDKFLVALRKAKTGHPLSAALLRSLSWWWAAMNFSADWLLNLAQIWQLPFRWANYDPSAPQGTIDSICAMLENMGNNAWAAFPAGTTLELKESKATGGNGPADNMIDRAEKNCDLLILGQTLTTDVGDSGSRALGDVHAKVKGDVVQAAANFAAMILNTQLVPALLRLNYGDDEEAPEFKPQEAGADEKEVLDFKREVFKGFMQDGTVCDVLANQTDFKALTRDVGLPVNEEYEDPYLSVASKGGQAESGEVVKDSEGDIVGGSVVKEENPKSQIPNPKQIPNDQIPNGGKAALKPDSTGETVQAKAADAPTQKFEKAAKRQYVEGFVADVMPVLNRLGAIQKIEDPEIFKARLGAWLEDFERLKADVLHDPESVQVMADILASALANGMAGKIKS